jgi:hypothetical protein
MPTFSEPQRIRIENIWDWKGATWGGPVPDENTKTNA